MSILLDSPEECPDCGEKEKLISGNFLLECCVCGWSYLNIHPCRICGEKSFSVAGCSGPGFSEQLYGCKQHPVTQAEVRAIWSRRWKD